MTATPAWPPKSAPRLFVDTTISQSARLSIEGQQAHYLAKVMRVGVGDAVMLCDNRTGEWLARVVEAGKREVIVEAERNTRPREDVPDFWLCPALLKKPNFDLVLEKATELGAAKIVPVVTRRCVADKLNPERARTIMIEAAEQCARTALPEIGLSGQGETAKLDQLLRDWPEGRKLFFADENGGMPAAVAFSIHSGPAGLLIGPEGGFDEAERAAVRAHPAAVALSLGPRILRGETAAIAGTALWMGMQGDWFG